MSDDGPRVGEKYRHWKGGIYEVTGRGRDAETGEKVVIYRDVAGNLWTRTLDAFTGLVDDSGDLVPRFAEYIPDIVEGLAEAWAAGGHAWDAIPDPAAYLGRGE